MTSVNATNASAAVQTMNGDTACYPGALTPDALMIYLQTRLEGLDGQITDIFEQQQKFEKLRGLLSKIRTELNKLSDQGDPNELKGEAHAVPGAEAGEAKITADASKIEIKLPTSALASDPTAGKDDPANAQGYEANIESLLQQIDKIDPQLAQEMRNDMRQEGQILYCQDGYYKGGEVSVSKDYIDSLMKDTEASAQMNMIKLQSSMSARQTAIQLSTNLISGLSESYKSIVANIRA